MINKLSNAYAPSAREEEVRKIIIKELSELYSDVKVDNLGNMIIHKPGKNKKIAITAPMDEVSFLITHIKNDKTVICTSISSVKSKALQNNLAIDEDKNLFICSKCQNITENIEKIRNVEFDVLDMCKVKKLNNEFISKTLIYNNNFTETDDFYIGKAMERSVCCSVLCDLAKKLFNSEYEFYFVFSAQNYCDKKGALTATFGIEIDELYNLCCVDAENEDISLGNGPVLILRDKMMVSDIDLVKKFDNIKPLQRLISSNFVCEGGYYQKQHTTQKNISVGIPVNFLGCFNEVVSKNDVNLLKQIFLEII